MEIYTIQGKNASPFSFSWAQKIDLSGAVVAVMGAAGNLGETFVYAAAHSGARLALIDLPPADAARRAPFLAKLDSVARNAADLSGNTPVVLLADVTSMEDLLAAAEQVQKTCGRIDIAVDFAGIHHPVYDLVKDDPATLAASFRTVIDINLTGAFLFTVAMSRVMVPQRSGHIIHLCSSGSRLSLYGSHAYNASKHGVEGLVKTAAAQLAPFGVRVNGIAPGTVITDLNRMLSFTEAGDYKPRAKSILAHTPTKRFITREGVAETLMGMCVAQRHLTGNVIFADDGYNVDGHSWPDGNEALYKGPDVLDALYRSLDEQYPPR